jgi:hypothetical protein
MKKKTLSKYTLITNTTIGEKSHDSKLMTSALRSYSCFTLILFMLFSCAKIEGPGGSSAITGNLSGRSYSYSNGSNGEQEITNITIPNGNNIEDGEYVLLNTPNGGTLYYIWFKWDNGLGPSPNLSGRTPIQVTFSFTQSNTTVAQNMTNAILNIAGEDFTVTVNNDIVTISNVQSGEVTDAEEFTQNITVDISNQGKDNTTEGTTFTEGPIVDNRVYLIYGDDAFYSEDTRSDAEGNYQFRNLNRGNYTVFAYSIDTLHPDEEPYAVRHSVIINERKEIVQAPGIFIYQ